MLNKILCLSLTIFGIVWELNCKIKFVTLGRPAEHMMMTCHTSSQCCCHCSYSIIWQSHIFSNQLKNLVWFIVDSFANKKYLAVIFLVSQLWMFFRLNVISRVSEKVWWCLPTKWAFCGTVISEKYFKLIKILISWHISENL